VRRSGVQATGQYVKLKCRHALKRLYQGNEIEKTRKEHVFAPPPSSTTHSPNPSHHLASPTTPKQPKRAPNPSPTLPSDPQTAHPNPAAELTFPTQPAHLSASHHITSHKLNAQWNETTKFPTAALPYLYPIRTREPRAQTKPTAGQTNRPASNSAQQTDEKKTKRRARKETSSLVDNDSDSLVDGRGNSQVSWLIGWRMGGWTGRRAGWSARLIWSRVRCGAQERRAAYKRARYRSLSLEYT
jgi:hypothetical protein